MSKSTTRILIIVGVVCRILGQIMSPSTNAPHTTINGLSALAAAIILFAWLILLFVGIIGALVKMAQLKRWGWFVALFFVLPVFIYIFVGPTTSRQTTPAYQPTPLN